MAKDPFSSFFPILEVLKSMRTMDDGIVQTVDLVIAVPKRFSARELLAPFAIDICKSSWD